jgi:hypothetical protein
VRQFVLTAMLVIGVVSEVGRNGRSARSFITRVRTAPFCKTLLPVSRHTAVLRVYQLSRQTSIALANLPNEYRYSAIEPVGTAQSGESLPRLPGVGERFHTGTPVTDTTYGAP